MSGSNELALSRAQRQYVFLQPDGSIDIDCGDDTSIAGQTWSFRLKATSTRSSPTSNNEAQYDFSVTLAETCKNDQLTSLHGIDDIDYFIGYTGLY